jgi:predicted transcriptional regulator
MRRDIVMSVRKEKRAQPCLVDLPDTISKSLDHGQCRCEFLECNYKVCPIFEFVFGLKCTHVNIYFYALQERRSIMDIANRVKKDRTTAVRLVQSMIKQGLITMEKEPLENGGIKNMYSAIPQEVLKEKLKETMENVEIAVDHLIKQDWTVVKVINPEA